MKLSILIPSMPKRAGMLCNLITELSRQIDQYSKEHHQAIEICILSDSYLSIGEKRNRLLDMASGAYVCFIDDDDTISRNYINLICAGLESKPDCCSLVGVMTTDGQNPELFEHSIKYKKYRTAEPTKGIKYERFPNHLNCIKAEIAKKFRFTNINFGEDTEWATKIHESGLLKVESEITDVIYHYNFIPVK